MRPVKFFFALLLGLAFFVFAAKLLFVAFVSLAALALLAFVFKGVFRLVMASGTRQDRYLHHWDRQMGPRNRYFEALPLDPYGDMNSDLHVSSRTIEVL